MTKRAQDRHRASARRTSAQPLAASWRPDGDEPGPARRRRTRKRGLRGLLATYSWRIYAVPVLVAVTVLVFIDTANDDGTPARADQISAVRGEQDPEAPAPADPKATEQPAVPPNLNIPTAELPKGAPYPKAGEGEFDIVPGRGERVGTGGELFTYTIEIERGIDLAPYGGKDSFASLVDTTLADPRGWAATGQVSVQRIDGEAEEPDVRMTLATPETIHQPDYCGYSIKYESSCWRSSESRVMINLARWVRGAVAFGGDIGTYRQYAINHEIGHAFDNGHVGCAKNGALAPVMMQQTFGVANDYVARLNDQVGNADPVQADGKTCRYNAWPNPQARPA
ncbi:DUF3152 domain-containing protein [Actinophytocola gossypii]|uniref:DUF3152 domain-containing protein n=1 Tax=Actinophytocola gossypii TaxID=2812003 RepID=UPI0021A90066|nr:DUF3152 domain-containing protein [Actinophytocola gossypii]